MEKKQRIKMIAMALVVICGLVFIVSTLVSIHSLKTEVTTLRTELKTSTEALSVQGNELATQAAAWGVLLSPYTAEQKAGFVQAVNQALQAK